MLSDAEFDLFIRHPMLGIADAKGILKECHDALDTICTPYDTGGKRKYVNSVGLADALLVDSYDHPPASAKIHKGTRPHPPAVCRWWYDSSIPRTSKRIQVRCNVCHGCNRPDCGECINCVDKPRFGGLGVRKRSCILKLCVASPRSHATTDPPLGSVSKFFSPT